MLFFSFAIKEHSGQKKPFQTSSFHAAATPRVWDSGTHRNNNILKSEISSILPKKKANPVSHSEPTSDEKCSVAKLLLQRSYMYLCLNL